MTTKTHCEHCGTHQDNRYFVKCTHGRHRFSITRDEAYKRFPNPVIVDYSGNITEDGRKK